MFRKKRSWRTVVHYLIGAVSVFALVFTVSITKVSDDNFTAESNGLDQAAFANSDNVADVEGSDTHFSDALSGDIVPEVNSTGLSDQQEATLSEVIDTDPVGLQGAVYNEDGDLTVYKVANTELSPQTQAYIDSHPETIVSEIEEPVQPLIGQAGLPRAIETHSGVNPNLVGGEGYHIFQNSSQTAGSMCSVGFTGVDSTTNAPVFMSAGHCLKDGDNKYPLVEKSSTSPAVGGSGQPLSSPRLGGSTSNSVLFGQYGGGSSHYATGEANSSSIDFAVVSLNTTDWATLPKVAKWTQMDALNGNLSNSAVDINAVSIPNETTKVGASRSGRTTGWKSSTEGTQGSGMVKVGDRYVYGFRVNVGADHGDSGGSVVQSNNAVGILSGGAKDASGTDFIWVSTLTNALDNANSNKYKVSVTSPVLTNVNASVSGTGDFIGTAAPSSTVYITWGTTFDKTYPTTSSCTSANKCISTTSNISGNWTAPANTAYANSAKSIRIASEDKYSRSQLGSSIAISFKVSELQSDTYKINACSVTYTGNAVECATNQAVINNSHGLTLDTNALQYTYVPTSSSSSLDINGKPLTAGTYTVKVTYNNEANYGTFTGISALTVSQKPLTVTGITPTNRPYNGTNIVSITGGTLQGVVALDAGKVTAIIPGSGTVATADAGKGKAVTYSAITIDGTAKGNYIAPTKPSIYADITKIEQLITGPSSLFHVNNGSPLDLANYISSSGGGQLLYTLQSSEYATINGSVVTPKASKVGTVNVNVNAAATTNHNAATQRTISIDIRNKTDVSSAISFTTVPTSIAYDGLVHSYTATISGTHSGGTMTYRYLLNGIPVNELKESGKYDITAVFDSSTEHGEKTVSITVNPASIPTPTAGTVSALEQTTRQYTFDVSTLLPTAYRNKGFVPKISYTDTNKILSATPTFSGNILTIHVVASPIKAAALKINVSYTAANYATLNTTVTVNVIAKTNVTISGVSVTNVTCKPGTISVTGTPKYTPSAPGLTAFYEYRDRTSTFWSKTVPTKAGDYQLRISVVTPGDYNITPQLVNFTIPKSTTIPASCQPTPKPTPAPAAPSVTPTPTPTPALAPVKTVTQKASDAIKDHQNDVTYAINYLNRIVNYDASSAAKVVTGELNGIKSSFKATKVSSAASKVSKQAIILAANDPIKKSAVLKSIRKFSDKYETEYKPLSLKKVNAAQKLGTVKLSTASVRQSQQAKLTFSKSFLRDEPVRFYIYKDKKCYKLKTHIATNGKVKLQIPAGMPSGKYKLVTYKILSKTVQSATNVSVKK